MQTFVKAALVALAVLWATPAHAQFEPGATLPPEGSELFRLGRTRLFPSLVLQDVGVDSNVYLLSQRQDDFTYTVVPKLVTVSEVGRAHVFANGGLGFTYFQRAADQRSVNGDAYGLVEVKTGRLRPFGELSYARRRQREADLDRRALSNVTTTRAGFELGLSGVTWLTAWVNQANVDYDRRETFAGRNLDEQLSRSSTTLAGGALFKVTPLTSVVVAGEAERTAFVNASMRDYRAYRVAPTVRFSEGAILSGYASAGIRDYRPDSSMLPRYRGFVAMTDVRFSLRNATRFAVIASRDLVSSFDELQPYYVGSSGYLQITQRVVGPLDVIGVGEARSWRYLARLDAGIPSRLERRYTWGSGVGVQVDEDVRVTLTVERQWREVVNGEPWRNYGRTRLMASIAYQP